MSAGRPGRPHVLGVTGGIGAGKSAFCRALLEAFQLPAIDADALGHEALHPGTTVYEALVARFGESFLDPVGRFDRARLGAHVFSEASALADLNAIVHPWILERIELRVAALMASGYTGIILLDAALLLEWIDRYRPDGIVLVRAPRETRLVRLGARGLSRDEALRRMAAQRSEEDWVRDLTARYDRAHDAGQSETAEGVPEPGTGQPRRTFWICENDGDLAQLEVRARGLYAEIIRAWGLPPLEAAEEGE